MYWLLFILVLQIAVIVVVAVVAVVAVGYLGLTIHFYRDILNSKERETDTVRIISFSTIR